MSEAGVNGAQHIQQDAAYVEPDPDLMIEDMSYQEAGQYVMSFLLTEKKTEKILQEKLQDLDRCNERLAYAEQHGDGQQLEQITRELHGLIQERDSLLAELEQLHRKNVVLKAQWRIKATRGGEAARVQAERLLADFSELVDVEEYKLQEAMKDQEAEDELAKLKAKLAGEQL
ncbi:hypothetical protein CSB45_01240 [candidate division KSB3 bacterium]|uniref:Uncharacterized protein n=1 Tax=candidate division KSB3 bacterium TaxID=2044937 RepID=A0A2G6EBA7_9BACT|nr:MAG: hypothetical protein CSB45_01240 [candidate division KSB3 bacterium]